MVALDDNVRGLVGDGDDGKTVNPKAKKKSR